ncbi:hypothetical protein ACLB2K_021898 [Fragaria x ananassa]
MGQCVDSPICYLYLKLAGTDDWRPGFAQVHVLEGSHSHLSSDYFYFRRYLPRRAWHGSDTCQKEVTPFGPKQKREGFAKKLGKDRVSLRGPKAERFRCFISAVGVLRNSRKYGPESPVSDLDPEIEIQCIEGAFQKSATGLSSMDEAMVLSGVD